MSDTTREPKSITPDWLVQGVLTKIGDTFDRLTGRGWKPSSSLATSQLIERLKALLDKESQVDEEGRTFVPHHISLRMQWDKFSTDSEEALQKLEAEFLVAVVDHINDKHYYTYGPLEVEIKPDYFTEGVKLYVSFEPFSESENEAGVAVPLGPKGTQEINLPAAETSQKPVFGLVVRFQLNGKSIEKVVKTVAGRRNSIGRTKENDISVDDISVSKYHATLLVCDDGSLVVADTGSTNGTFINGERIAYGKAIGLGPKDQLKVGVVTLELQVSPLPSPVTDSTIIGLPEESNGSEPSPTSPAGSWEVGE